MAFEPYEIRVNRGYNHFRACFKNFERARRMADEWGVCVWENGRKVYEARESGLCEPTRECEADKQAAAKARDGDFSQTQATQNEITHPQTPSARAGAGGWAKIEALKERLKSAKHKEA